jgi:hypothetical protein
LTLDLPQFVGNCEIANGGFVEVAEFGPLLIRVSEANEIVVVDFCLLVYCC